MLFHLKSLYLNTRKKKSTLKIYCANFNLNWPSGELEKVKNIKNIILKITDRQMEGRRTWFDIKKKKGERKKQLCVLTVRASPEAWPKEIWSLLKGNWNLADSLGDIFSQFRDVYNMYMETIGSKLRYIEIHDKTGFTPVNRQIICIMAFRLKTTTLFLLNWYCLMQQ